MTTPKRHSRRTSRPISRTLSTIRITIRFSQRRSTYRPRLHSNRPTLFMAKHIQVRSPPRTQVTLRRNRRTDNKFNSPHRPRLRHTRPTRHRPHIIQQRSHTRHRMKTTRRHLTRNPENTSHTRSSVTITNRMLNTQVRSSISTRNHKVLPRQAHPTIISRHTSPTQPHSHNSHNRILLLRHRQIKTLRRSRPHPQARHTLSRHQLTHISRVTISTRTQRRILRRRPHPQMKFISTGSVITLPNHHRRNNHSHHHTQARRRHIANTLRHNRLTPRSHHHQIHTTHMRHHIMLTNSHLTRHNSTQRHRITNLRSQQHSHINITLPVLTRIRRSVQRIRPAPRPTSRDDTFVVPHATNTESNHSDTGTVITSAAPDTLPRSGQHPSGQCRSAYSVLDDTTVPSID